VKSIAAVTLLAAIIGSVYGCASGTSATSLSGSNPPVNSTPTITTMSPNTALAGGATFTLTVNGTNFIASSVVNFGGIARATTFGNATQLIATIPAAAIVSAGTASVSVTNPGGGASSMVNFTIASGTNPIPTISDLDPGCAPVGAQAFTLAVFGSNFVAGSVVRWNGSDRPSQVFGTGEIDANIPASDIATIGTATVTVFNPAPGGGSSSSSTLTVTAGGVGPQSIAVDPTGKFAYVASQGCLDAFPGTVSMYTIDSTSGALTSIGAVKSGDFNALSVAVDPSGKFAYVANDGGETTPGSVSMYTINPTSGLLTSIGTVTAPCAPPPSPGSCSPASVAVHPSGKFVYVANAGGFAPTSISMYTVGGSGVLGFIGTTSAGGRAVWVTVDPLGRFAYAVNDLGSPGSGVTMYTINATSGLLTSIGSVPAGTEPRSLVVDPTGKFAYVANSGSQDVSMFTIDGTTGALTSVGTIVAGGGDAMAIHPSGKFAYVGNSLFAIDSNAGFLTFLGTTGTGGSSIAIHPSGKFAYVTNGANSVSMYSVDVNTGALTLIGTIST
jgi:6-phosphogluconolactonase (cycloisomerase 2 family)